MESPTPNGRHNENLDVQVRTAVGLLQSGGVVAIPTDTLYGLAACAFDEDAVERVYRIKRRPGGKGLPLLLADPADIPRYTTSIPQLAWTLIERFMPGGLTLVLRKAPSIPDVVSGGLDTIAVRVPDHWVPRKIARDLGAPITGTSANRTGMPDPRTSAQVQDQLGPEVDMVVDAGDATNGLASTIVDFTSETPRVIREGAVSRREIVEAVGEAVVTPDGDTGWGLR